MSKPAHRFNIYDSTFEQLLETSSGLAGALMIAGRYSRRLGYSIEVSDSMARVGQPELWRVDEKQTATGTHGSVVVVSRREEEAA